MSKNKVRLTNNERIVLDELNNYRSDWKCNPSQMELSGMCNVSQSQISIILRKLAEKGKIELGKRGKVLKVK